MSLSPRRPAVSVAHYELAMRYFSDCDKDTASRKLTNWIRQDNNLLMALVTTGYQPRRRFLTPKQVRLIYEHLGYPAIPDEDLEGGA